MINLINPLIRLGCALLLSAQSAWAQSAQQQGIASTTQILDTSVLFAIGAREAEQAIRGSFGWPTFQEGFVDRVYFRFDPDGYARFSTSPRLDEDVFEVICAESSTACLAQKPSLEIGLTIEGKIQIKVADITPQDSFYVSDRKSELPLPPTVLEPLDARLETLLASGGHLVVKREVETVQEISLAGFSAVATYLRWVAQGQSPRVFPRGWPVPAQVETQNVGGLTQPGVWTTPNAGPQNTQTTFSQAGGQNGFQGQLRGSTGMELGQQRLQYGGLGSQGLPAGGQAAGGVFLPQQQLGGQQILGNTQSTIQALQLELAQLRAGQNQPLTQNGAQLQDDFANGFAQQAQARSLPTPVGYGANSEAVEFTDQQEATKQGFDVQRSVSPIVRANPNPSITREMQVFETRVYALEVAVNELRRTILTEMNALKWSRGTGIESVNPVAQDNVAPVASNDAASMDALEKLLLERLGKRDVVAAPVAVETAATFGGQEADRTLVMDLLKQLEQGQTPVAQAPVIAEPEAVSEPAKDGFVTLSDYINEMLKSEGGAGSNAN